MSLKKVLTGMKADLDRIKRMEEMTSYDKLLIQYHGASAVKLLEEAKRHLGKSESLAPIQTDIDKVLQRLRQCTKK